MSDEWFGAEERFALALAPLAQEIMDRVRGMLPPSVKHFGIFILTPDIDGEARVIAATTDRKVMGPQVAQWFLSTKDAP